MYIRMYIYVLGSYCYVIAVMSDCSTMHNVVVPIVNYIHRCDVLWVLIQDPALKRQYTTQEHKMTEEDTSFQPADDSSPSLALLKKLVSIETNDEFLLFSTLHAAFCKRVKWEPLFRDKYPSYYRAVQDLHYDSKYAYVDLYTAVMYFTYVFRDNTPTLLPASRLEIEYKIAWPLHCWTSPEALHHAVHSNGLRTLSLIAPYLIAKDVRECLIHVRTREMADVLLNRAPDGQDPLWLTEIESGTSEMRREWKILFHEFIQIASESSNEFEKTEMSHIGVLLLDSGVEYDPLELLDVSVQGELFPLLDFLLDANMSSDEDILDLSLEKEKIRVSMRYIAFSDVRRDDVMEYIISNAIEFEIEKVISAISLSEWEETALANYMVNRGSLSLLEVLLRKVKNEVGSTGSIEVLSCVRKIAAMQLIAEETAIKPFLPYLSSDEKRDLMRNAFASRTASFIELVSSSV